MIGCQLNHLFIIFGTQIHEIIIDRIYYLPFHVHFIMQMRTSTFSCTTHFSDNLTTYHFLSDFRIKSLQVSIPSEIPETMIYLMVLPYPVSHPTFTTVPFPVAYTSVPG